MRRLTILTALLAAFAAPAAAQEVTAIGTHGQWTAYTYQEDGNAVCYMAAKPSKSAGNYSRRGDVMLLVTHRPAEKAFDVVSVVAGYQYDQSTDAQLTVGRETIGMFTNGERAWTRDSAADAALVQSMIKGNSLIVKGTSSRGTATTDTYSLSGFTAAYKAISESCKKPA